LQTNLVSAVKESIVTLLLKDVRNLLPLVPRRVNTSRVVRASVEEEDGLARGGTEEVEEFREGEADVFGVVVGVVDGGETSRVKDRLVVGYGKGEVSKGKIEGKRGKETHPMLGWKRR
jgi:hypothetical protein